MYKYLVLALFSVLFAGCSHRDKPFEQTTPELKSGDLIFRLGRSERSLAVTLADKHSEYSHVGMVASQGDKLVIIHAAAGERPRGGVDSVRLDSLSNFLSSGKTRQALIVRYPMSDSLAQKIGDWAMKIYEQGTVFDSRFNLEDTTRIYCTELIYHAFQSQGIDLSRGRRHTIPGFFYPLLFPSDLLSNSKLEEIYYFNW